ncbi:MAG TPA: hypothetical protein PKD00_00265 [Burkholderiales bacterium]|nr:hypothetical protein [Burkholderiales bacterium]
MEFKILLDSVSPIINSRITTIYLKIPFYLLTNLLTNSCNYNYRITDTVYNPYSHTSDKYCYDSALEFLSLNNNNNLKSLFNYCEIIMTSVNWFKIFDNIFNNVDNKNYLYTKDFLAFISHLENQYVENTNIYKKTHNQYHVPFNNNDYLPAKLQDYIYRVSNFDVHENAASSQKNLNNTILTNTKPILNHIAKHPTDKELSSGMLNYHWNQDIKSFTKGKYHNVLYEKWIPLSYFLKNDM